MTGGEPVPDRTGDTPRVRAGRFARACAAYGNRCVKGRVGPDSTVPGAAAGVARYALICETERHFTANYCESVDAVADVAVHELREGAAPQCFYDLDELAGDPPCIADGDVVRLDGEQFYVHHVDEELIEGEIARYLCLTDGPDAAWDDWKHRIDEGSFEGEVIERGEPDDRLPMRYDVADTVVRVIFNTRPAAGDSSAGAVRRS
jgi:hypothetical protein